MTLVMICVNVCLKEGDVYNKSASIGCTVSPSYFQQYYITEMNRTVFEYGRRSVLLSMCNYGALIVAKDTALGSFKAPQLYLTCNESLWCQVLTPIMWVIIADV